MEKYCPICYSMLDPKDTVCQRCGAKLGPEKGSNPWIIIGVLIMILIIISVSFFVIYKSTQEIEKGIEIDGDFRDWLSVPLLSDTNEFVQFNPNVDIIEYGVDDRASKLSLYLRVEGDILNGEPDMAGNNQIVDTVFIFIDTDQSPTSGYFINGIGADYMVEVYGWDGEIFNSNLYSYSSIEQDWAFWQYESSVLSAIAGCELEAQVSQNAVSMNEFENVDIIFYTQSWDRNEDFSDVVISNEVGVLSIRQFNIGPAVISGDNNRLLRLSVEALNANITINEITVTRTGTGSDYDLNGIRLQNENGLIIAMGTLNNNVVIFHPELSLSQRENIALDVVVDIDHASVAGNCIGFRIENHHDVLTDIGTVSIIRTRAVPSFLGNSYLISIPTNVSIDGAFGDWADDYILHDPWGDVSHENLDITNYGISISEHGIAFYLGVHGEICRGVEVPYWCNKTAFDDPKDDSSVIFPSGTGEDTVYIFIDTNTSWGYSESIPLNAIYMIEVKGRYNKVTSSSYFVFSGESQTHWNWTEIGSVYVELNDYEMEVSIDWQDIGLDPNTDNFKVYFMTTDWMGTTTDYSNGEGRIEWPAGR